MKIFISVLMLCSCVNPKLKFQKGMVLDPTMDPQKTDRLHATLFSSDTTYFKERASASSKGSVGATCPTCGG